MKRILISVTCACMLLCSCSNKSNTQYKELVVETPNSFEAVDYILVVAKDDAKTATKKDVEFAISFLSDNFSNYYSDNATMETVIYYGALLDYGCRETNKDYEKLGVDATNSVKDVYWNIETASDHFSKTNYEQVLERLQDLGFEPK